jgi:hypothetical protein
MVKSDPGASCSRSGIQSMNLSLSGTETEKLRPSGPASEAGPTVGAASALSAK